ncbi:fumarylacetoacetate hydrolase family protein [Sphingobium subterraneum]|uniref:2-keto-4-pentenoate hydratase/2-oxohepta-3-ene-1,7-dioic acid hydratase in catechol pathway n=1 Tax=Sphingobium subterraneum TaxID=627688 RepID=A0A841J2N9_9SPHN|nr:fumarylacetoacetate hydrolase family protein [Sphingobium subterraneum]MBB6125223.1 2-keto-4-pentenoate hydratase/2-oxohepta-3-ene-1,7-dioic acid hydratase in catechol pathway [Sphingobium subterraneum]
MKLVRYEVDSEPVIGVVSGDGIIRIADLLPEFTEMQQLAAAGPEALDRLRDRMVSAQPTVALEGAKLLAPMERPRNFLAIGMNYLEHCKEGVRLGVVPPEHQVWFNKSTISLSPYNVDIDPGVTRMLDYEVELGVAIGKKARYVSKEEAPAHVFGYFVANDVSARDWQLHSQTWFIGKSFENFGPIGPWIVTPDEVGDPHTLGVRTYVNGELRQNSNTEQLIHNVWEMIEYVSTAYTLEPGDLLLTGTPEGVGHAMIPQAHIGVGDFIRCEIDKLGATENKVVPSTAPRYPELEPHKIARALAEAEECV